MSNKTKYSFDEERYLALLDEALAKVNREEDPVVITQMRDLFKKKVPFSRRMYVAAYLAKIAAFGGKPYLRHSRKESFHDYRNSDRASRPEQEHRDFRGDRDNRTENTQVTRRVSIDESLATTLFISIGRNRRVFYKDLISLLIQEAGLERERIGDIRTLENYSFVQVFKDDAEKVIAALNGLRYRGRELSVSYSRKKEDATENLAESETSESVVQEENTSMADYIE
ncbi:MAG: DbpA RNA binding domain-containing protein [Spirochaetaceae bacterium]|nr:DbpA RNA binding domain-containing protein [Spirochaetaceae bacterium]